MIDVQHTYPLLRNLTLEAHQMDYFNPLPLHIVHHQDCYGLPYKPINKGDINIVGGGLRLACSSGVGTLYDFDEQNSIEITEDIIFVGHISSVCWGHTITDSTARLWWVANNKHAKLRILPIFYISETPLCGNYLEFIKLLGIPENHLHRLVDITHFHSVYLPDVCFDNHRVSLKFSKEYVSLINKVLNHRSKIPLPKKIFLVKKNSRRQICSEDVYKIITKHGYVMIHPDELSVPDQLSLFQNAESIISEESSLSHNFIFCRDGTKVVILRKANTINIYQALINQLRKLDVAYIDCHLSIMIKQRHRGPFFLYANKNFCEYFQEIEKTFPHEEFVLYLKNEGGENFWKTTLPLDVNYKEIIHELLMTHSEAPES